VTVSRFLTWVADHPVAVLPLAVAAVAERVAWTMAGHMAMLDTELRNAAMHWATTGWIADAFRAGSGPTAHVGVLPVLIPGTIMRIFGVDTPTTTLALTMISALVIVATAFALNRAFRRLGTPALARGGAVLLVCLIPLHVEIESRSLRVYENGTAALLLSLMLLSVVRLEERKSIGVRDLLGLSALAAFMIALSPALALCVLAMLGVLALRRLGWPGRAKAVALLGLAIFLTTLPWALRNREIMGETVWTRSNFGLEFAIGTHAAAVDPADPAVVYLARLAQVHPHDSETGYRAFRAAGGELAYSRKLGNETWQWVGDHPRQATQIWLRHLGEFYFPPIWMWLQSGKPDVTTPFRFIIVDGIAAMALFGLAGALVRRQWIFLYALAPVVLIALPYILAQPLVRYRYVIASLLVFLAADALARLLNRPATALS
jgi:hypothetical protein